MSAAPAPSGRVYKHLLRLIFFSHTPHFFLWDSKIGTTRRYGCSLLFFFPKTCQFDDHDHLGNLRKTLRVQDHESAAVSITIQHRTPTCLFFPTLLAEDSKTSLVALYDRSSSRLLLPTSKNSKHYCYDFLRLPKRKFIRT